MPNDPLLTSSPNEIIEMNPHTRKSRSRSRSHFISSLTINVIFSFTLSLTGIGCFVAWTLRVGEEETRKEEKGREEKREKKEREENAGKKKKKLNGQDDNFTWS